MVSTSQPVTHQLHTKLREQLRSSLAEHTPGGRVPSERDLAKQFGVSTMTVSRALHDLQQEGFLERIPGKGTFLSDREANGQAPRVLEKVSQAPEAPLTESIFVSPRRNVVPEGVPLNAWLLVQLQSYEKSLDRSSEFWPHRIVSHLEREIQGGGGKTTILVCQDFSEAQIHEACRQALDAGINAVFFIKDERNENTEIWMEQLAKWGIRNGNGAPVPAIVQISLSGSVGEYFDSVSFDGEWGAYLATQHLLELGHRRIAFLAPCLPVDWLNARIRGFHRALRSYGVRVPRGDGEFSVVRTEVAPLGPEMWQEMGRSAARVFDSPEVTAVVAANDQMASMFIATARRQNRPVPDSLSVVGYDDWYSSALEGLTTIHPPIDGLADAALGLARRRLGEAGGQDHVALVLKPTLIARNSTRALAV